MPVRQGIDVISDEARRADNLAVLDRFAHGAYGSRLSAGDVSEALDASRAERDAELRVNSRVSE